MKNWMTAFNVAEQTMVDELEICDVDYNKAIIETALRSALSELLVSILEGPSSIRDRSKNSISQVQRHQSR